VVRFLQPRALLFVTVVRAAAESLASEHASRLAALQAAERSIAERLDELGGEFRRRRQAAITDELLDVVTGYEVIRGEAAPGDLGG
jgi:F-type H+-transporting ATPase subunit gamma